MGPKMGPETGQNRDRRAKAISIRDCSGSLLGPLEALLGGLKSEKMPTIQRENHFFINAVFWLFEAPNGPLGLILVPLGRIWSQNGSQNGYQKFSKK